MQPTQDGSDIVADLHPPKRESFKHDPLDYTKGSIRLVRILPRLSAAEQLIQCEIIHAETNASYECLSYRWGDPYPEHSILLNGKRFRVRQNLFDFLQLMHARSRTAALDTTSSVLFWIDSLCIDQSKTIERNHQVAQMGTIYRNAASVNIWLGKCRRLIETLCREPDLLEGWGSSPVSPYQPNGRISPLLALIYRTYGPDILFGRTRFRRLGYASVSEEDFSEDKRLVLKRRVLEEDFFDNEYWKRAWITQEIYVAKTAVVVLESEEFSISTLMHILFGCAKYAIHENNIVKKFALFLGFDNSGIPLIQPGRMSNSFLALLRQFSDKHCTIPRDRLYSLLSLYYHGRKVAIDYAQPDDELLCQVVKYLYEPVGLCSVIHISRSLMPQSEPLGTGYIEIDSNHLTLGWGLVQSFNEESSMSEATSPYTCRTLLAIHLSEFHSTGTPCRFLPKLLEKLQGKATLIETQVALSKDYDFTSYGEQIMAVPSSETTSRFLDIMPPSGKMSGPSTLQIYGNGFSFANKDDLWVLRIQFSLVWSMLGAANPAELCCNLHRFPYDDICRGVRVGCNGEASGIGN